MRSASGLIPLAVVVSLVPAATVSAGTLSGRLTATDGIDPKTEAGTVRAVRLRSLTLAAAARTDRRGRFRLAVPSGSYAVLGAVPSLRGRALRSAVSLAKVRRGRATRVIMQARQGSGGDPCKQGSRWRRAICRQARTRGLAQASVARPTVAIETFTSRGDNPVAGRALSEWLTTDMYRAASGDCRPQVVERTRLKDLLDEMLLQQQPYFDPRTRQVFAPPKVDFVVRGSTVSTGNALSWSLKLVRSGNGKLVKAEVGSASGTEALTASEGIARRLAEAACDEDQPDSSITYVYDASYSGAASYSATENCPGPSGYSLQVNEQLSWNRRSVGPDRIFIRGNSVLGHVDTEPTGQRVYTSHEERAGQPPDDFSENTDHSASAGISGRGSEITFGHEGIYGGFGPNPQAAEIDRKHPRSSYVLPVSGSRHLDHEPPCTGSSDWSYNGTWTLTLVERRR